MAQLEKGEDPSPPDDRADALAATNPEGQRALQAQETNRRTGLWDYQGGDGVPAVPPIEGNQGTLCPKYVGENAVMAKATAQIAVGTETKANPVCA